jgi:hypothetical protein
MRSIRADFLVVDAVLPNRSPVRIIFPAEQGIVGNVTLSAAFYTWKSMRFQYIATKSLNYRIGNCLTRTANSNQKNSEHTTPKCDGLGCNEKSTECPRGGQHNHAPANHPYTIIGSAATLRFLHDS